MTQPDDPAISARKRGNSGREPYPHPDTTKALIVLYAPLVAL